MDIFTSYNIIIVASLIIIISFIFNGVSKRTNVPSVLLLIVLGVILQYVLKLFSSEALNFLPVLEILGIVGLIMIVLEAALELELKREKLMPILKSMVIALVGLVASAWIAALILHQFVPNMTMQSAWLYATPLSILSSAIIIPSVSTLDKDKKEFHIYESTFSDIIGIMMFYFLTGSLNPEEDSGVAGFAGNILLTIIISLVVSYAIILIFQKIKSQVKLFLLIAILLLLYALGKKMHLSSLIIILIFGLVIANMKLFFSGKLKEYLDYEKAHQIYHELHIITLETAFVVRTFFFVIFGLTIAIASIFDISVVLISILIIISIYVIRFGLLRLFFKDDIFPQLFIAPRGLITVLLFYAIPAQAQVASFNSGILLFVIISTSIIMTVGMIRDKRLSKSLKNDEKESSDSTAAIVENKDEEFSPYSDLIDESE